MVFAITVAFIVVSAVVTAFTRGRMRDKCLKDFSDDLVVLEQTSGKLIQGKLIVENTGMELIYTDKKTTERGHEQASSIFYKYEYPNMQALIRYHDLLDAKAAQEREEQIKKIYHPTWFRRMGRKFTNLFKTVRDSVVEVSNLLMSRAKKTATAGGVLTSQDKYVTQMKNELMGSVGTSFEPLLEKYIGHKVVLKLIRSDTVLDYSGILKEYTAEFVELMDVDYKTDQDQDPRRADIVVLRKHSVVRHLGE